MATVNSIWRANNNFFLQKNQTIGLRKPLFSPFD
ncbi:MAG: hypothetical protein ACI9VT_002023 [Psychroserpens sp.]|jgi:hypothetical protein